MSEDMHKDENKEKETPADSSTAKETDRTSPGDDVSEETSADGSASDKGAGKGDDDGRAEPMIPKHRFDEVLTENKKLRGDIDALSDKFNRMGEALTGKGKSDAADDEIEGLARKYNVPTGFMEDLIKVAEKRSQKAVSGDMASVKKTQAEQAYRQELEQLMEEIPEAADMTKEERESLRKMAFDPKYSRAPLSDVYKIATFGRPAGRKKTVEGSRGGAGRASDGEPDISSMSLEEFEKYSNQLAQKSRG